jgi:hypothetical protein
MKLEATTRIDYRTYHKFYLFNFLLGKRSPWQARVLLFLTPVLFIVFLVLFLLRPTDLVNLAGMLIMFMLLVLLLSVIWVAPLRYYRSVQKKLDAPIDYMFTEEQVEASQVKPVQYDMISAAYETREFFYIYVSRRQIYIVGKKDFTTGSADDLSRLLKIKLGERFHVRSGATGAGT